MGAPSFRRGWGGRLPVVPVALAVLALLAAAAPPLPAAAGGANGRDGEYRLKAAFLYNFARFASWPPDAFAGSPSHVVIAVVGSDPFGRLLDEYEGKPVGARTVAVRRFPSADQVGPCHVLFVGASEKGRLGRIVRHARGRGILTVGDGEEYSRRGLAIAFVRAGERLAFEIDPDAAAEGGVRPGSKLLTLGTIVAPGACGAGAGGTP